MTTDQLSPEDVQRVTDDLAEGPVPESRATSTDTGALLIAFFKRPREEGTARPTSSRKRGERSAVMLCPVKERPEGLRAFLRLGLPGEAAKTAPMVASGLRFAGRAAGRWVPLARRRTKWPARSRAQPRIAPHPRSPCRQNRERCRRRNQGLRPNRRRCLRTLTLAPQNRLQGPNNA